MTISKKMLLALGMICVMVVMSIAIPFMTTRDLKDVKADLVTYEALQDEIGFTQDLQIQVANVWQFMTDASLTRELKSINQEAKTAYDKAQALVNRLLEMPGHDPEQIAKLKEIQQGLPVMWQAGTRMFDGYAVSRQAGNLVMEEYDKACDRVINAAAYTADKSRARGRAEMKGIDGDITLLNTKVTYSGAGAAMLGLVVIVIMFLLRNMIVRKLQLIIEAIGCLATGDLSKTFASDGNDEIAQVNSMVNTLVESLRKIIVNIADAAARVSTESVQLAAISEQMARGAEEVADESGAIATAGEEMAATSGDIARNCQLAAEGAQRTSQAASDGSGVVAKTVLVMGQIADRVQESSQTVESLGARSDQIGAIIGTIEDIADQTNLLALNAAIEAARAGEQGRGFAVVADEVRALAERTTRATREIGEMIKNIQTETQGAVAVMVQGGRQVESGKQEAARSGDALQTILSYVNEVAMQVSQIATAAEQQTSTTDEISRKMYHITEVIHETATGATHSARSAEQLRNSADELQAVVRQFRV